MRDKNGNHRVTENNFCRYVALFTTVSLFLLAISSHAHNNAANIIETI